MRRPICLLAFMGVMLLGGLQSDANAVTIDFTALNNAFTLPAHYQGLNWQGFNSLNSINHAGDAPGNMYAYFNLGPSYTAFPFIARISADENEVFNLDSGIFSANWKPNLVVKVQGLLDGNLLQETSITLAYRSFNLVNFNFVGVDEVKFVLADANYTQYSPGLGGTGKPYYWQQQYAFSMDNLDIDGPTPVPEPGTLLLVGAGLAGMAAFRRQLKK